MILLGNGYAFTELYPNAEVPLWMFCVPMIILVLILIVANNHLFPKIDNGS